MKNRWMSAAMVLTLVVLGFGAAPLLAQTTGDIDGTVADPKGAPLPGVSVELKSPALQGARNSVTDGSGRYRFPALPPGVYTVTGSLSGFTKAERTNVRVVLGGTASVDMVLSLSVKEEVVVTGEAPVIDTSRGTIGTTTSIDTIQKLPLGRNFTSIASTVAGTGTSAGGGVTVYGATGLENQYIIDGVNTTGIKIGDQGKTLNNEFVQEVEVKTGGYEAEYSRALGGVINVVTKSGGNEFHGDLFGYYDAKGLAASDKNTADRSSVGVGELVLPKRLDVGADLGGYFVKDRLWFFGAYDRVNRDQDVNSPFDRTYTATTITTLFKPEVNETRTNLFSGKLTFRLGESNTVQLSAFGDPGEFKGDLSGVVGADSARLGTNKFGGTDLSAKWDGIFGTSFLAQAQYGRHEEKNQDDPLSTALSVRNRRGGLSTYVPGSGNPLYNDEKYKRDAFRVAATGFLGTNEIKVGLDYENITSKFNEAYGGGAITTNFLSRGGAGYQFTANRYFSKVPLNCISRFDADGNPEGGNFGTPGPANAQVPNVQSCLGYTPSLSGVTNEPTTRNLGFFVQDSWKAMKNLTVNLGIRYDQQALDNAEGVEVIKLKNEWSPRIGIVWDFTNNGKSKFYANYGRYYTTIPQDIQTRALGNEYTTFAYNYTQTAANGTFDPVGDPNVASYAYIQGGSLLQPGLKGMYQDEYIAGIEYELVKNWSFGVKGIYKSLGRVVEDRCDLADPRVGLTDFIPAGSLTTCSLVNYGEASSALNTIRDPSDPNCIAADGTVTGPCEPTKIRRYYRGAELTATHRFSNNFYMLTSYLYSSLKGNYDGNEKQSTGQQDPNINADFDYLELIPNNFGRLSLDRKHQFKISGTYSFPFGLTVGLSGRLNAGAPLIVTGYARPGYTGERFLLPERGYLTDLPTQYEADLHLEYGLRLGAVTITPVIDIFNLLNRQGVTGVNGNFNAAAPITANDPSHQIGNVSYPNCTAATANYNNSACATNPNYLKSNAWQNPLQARIGARVSF